MKKFIDFQQIRPHLIALGIFIILSFAYFNPVLEGKMLRQGDMMAYAGMVQELKELEKNTGEYALWTDRMFGGMPTFLMNNPGFANLTRHIHNLLNLYHPRPANHLFLYMIGFYLALLLFGVSPRISIAGAIAYAFSTYSIIIIDAGHITKVMAIGYLPLVVGAFWFTLRKNILQGTILFALALSMQLYVNHLQITYYTAIILVFLGLYEFTRALRQKLIASFATKMLWLFVGALLAAASNLTTLWTVYEYGKFSMRGKPNIVESKNQSTTGLPIDYITAWSYGKVETLNLLVPNLKGGSSHMNLGKNSETYKTIEQNYGKRTADQYASYLDTYWGEQPFTSGPVYLGASVIFLFLLAFFIVRGRFKWWILGVTILAIFLAWGKHFMWFNELFIHYIPAYNKFRTVSMTLVIVQFTVPLLAILAFDRILNQNIYFNQVKKPLLYTTASLSALLILIWIAIPLTMDMVGRSDSQLPEIIQKSLKADRLIIFKNDIYRSLLFILVTSGLVFAVLKNKIKKSLAVALLALLFALDLIPVSLRYAQNENWVSRGELQAQPYKPTEANKYILRDKDHYRVLNLAGNTFNDAATSYFHHSIGGYHGAKMQRYQELIDWQIIPEMQQLINYLSVKPTVGGIDSLLHQSQVLNMLNTRYLIVSPDNPPLINTYAFGPAWIVDSVYQTQGAKNEMLALNNVNLKTTAVLGEEFPNLSFGSSSNSSITLINYHPNRLKYQYTSKEQVLAVFSEIFYPKGWEAYINGQKAEILRVNYLLRGLILPAGEGIIEFEFRPKSFFTGNIISYASSGLLLVLGIVIAILSLNQHRWIKKFEVQNTDKE